MFKMRIKIETDIHSLRKNVASDKMYILKTKRLKFKMFEMRISYKVAL